ncbi:hypothetical protein EVAR_95851_1 [Eumeta japonica]|uniref:Uncharacterized protein n=1 Tax=Eumeta variegata TaxID=151549 RepID=A0A4C1VML9_EUMVA|nr:hypothetical protein EVAR_95851_1 [Eumeta japonica]
MVTSVRHIANVGTHTSRAHVSPGETLTGGRAHEPRRGAIHENPFKGRFFLLRRTRLIVATDVSQIADLTKDVSCQGQALLRDLPCRSAPPDLALPRPVCGQPKLRSHRNSFERSENRALDRRRVTWSNPALRLAQQPTVVPTSWSRRAASWARCHRNSLIAFGVP